MSILSTSELEYIRSSIESMLPDICNILSATLTSDGAGGMTELWGTVGASVPCRLDALSGNKNLQGANIAPQFSYVLTLAHDISIDTINRVEVGSSTFTVTSVDIDKSWPGCVRAYLERT